MESELSGLKHHEELAKLIQMGYYTTKNINEIKGCTDELDPVSLLNFLVEQEF